MSPENAEKYLIGSERDLRNVILLLVKAVTRSRHNAMAGRMIITAISKMPQDQRKALTESKIQAELKSAERQFAQQTDPGLARIVKLLEGDDAFLEDVRMFASHLLW